MATSSKKIADEPICTSAEEYFKIKEFEENIHYVFKNKYLLLEATKTTYSQRSDVEFNYDRLAFLGDAVLEFMITRNLFDEKELCPAELHEKKVSLINKDFKEIIAIKHEFYLFISDKKIQQLVSKFKEYHKCRNSLSFERTLFENFCRRHRGFDRGAYVENRANWCNPFYEIS